MKTNLNLFILLYLSITSISFSQNLIAYSVTQPKKILDKNQDLNKINDDCKPWTEYKTQCLSSVADGTGSSKAGIRSRVCKISDSSTQITVKTEIEAINGGIDNIKFYKGLRIFYGDGSEVKVSKEEFNKKGKIIKEFTANKNFINNRGKDWNELSSRAYLVIWCENN